MYNCIYFFHLSEGGPRKAVGELRIREGEKGFTNHQRKDRYMFFYIRINSVH